MTTRRVPTPQQIDEVLTKLVMDNTAQSESQSREETDAFQGILLATKEYMNMLAAFIAACHIKGHTETLDIVYAVAPGFLNAGIEIGLRMAQDDMIPPGKVN